MRGQPYRLLAIPEMFSLYRFAEAITDSFSFGFDHPFGFYSSFRNYYDSSEGYELFADDPETRWLDDERRFMGVKKTPVNKVFKNAGKKMLFLFDYGDEWHFKVELKSIQPAKHGKPYPELVVSVGEAYPQYEELDVRVKNVHISVDNGDVLFHLDEILEKTDLMELMFEDIQADVFLKNEKRHKVTFRIIREIGKAIGNLTPALRERYPQTDWKTIDELRNLAAQKLRDIDPAILWDYSTEKLLGLKESIGKMITNEIDRQT